MLKLYLVRHGETLWNQENRVLGRTDIPLNERGIAQAQALGAKLADVHFDHVYCSPLSRAKETAAQIVAAQKGTGTPAPVEAAELIEMNFGTCEGLLRDSEAYRVEKHRYFARYPEGESFLDIAARIYPYLEKLRREHDGETILLVTHNGICRMITSYFQPMSNEGFETFTQGNAEEQIFIMP